jgi:quercetin dioxygenase-like cupin family protein
LPPPPAATAASCTSRPAPRTVWHSDPLGQTVFVTEGVGRCQRRGGQVEEIRPGDRVFFEPDEEHWHGAAPNRLMTHLALTENPGEQPATNWGEKVTEDEYRELNSKPV